MMITGVVRADGAKAPLRSHGSAVLRSPVLQFRKTGVGYLFPARKRESE